MFLSTLFQTGPSHFFVCLGLGVLLGFIVKRYPTPLPGKS